MPRSAISRARRLATMVENLRQADVGEQVGARAVAAPARELLPDRRGVGVLRVVGRQCQAFAARLGEHLLAELARLLLLHRLQVVADPRTHRPVRTKFSHAGLGRAPAHDDFDDVAAAQLGAQRDRLAVDLGGDAVVPDVRVDRVREVHRRRAARQREDLRLGREDVDRVRKRSILTCSKIRRNRWSRAGCRRGD